MRRLAVIGSGVAGLVAAHVAGRDTSVTLYEADDRLGGHAHTHEVCDNGRALAVDTGFIVHNDRTYPVLTRLFRELGVRTRPSEMSMSVQGKRAGAPPLEWAGALGARGLFPTWSTVTDPGYLRMLTEIPRFHRMAAALLRTGPGQIGPDHADPDQHEETVAQFLARGGFSPYFERYFATPLIAAVWSCEPDSALEYPARYLFTFLAHHGMLGIFGSPQWRTVEGGSRTYVEAVASGIDEVLLGTAVTGVSERDDGVVVTDVRGGSRSFDAVVVAAHPHQALAMLADPTPAQQEVLSSIGYGRNPAVLHTDISLLPAARRAWACWNHRERADAALTVTYDLTRLMRLDTDTHYLVTLGGDDLIDPACVIARMDYEHPRYTTTSVAAQRRLPEIDSPRLAFAGAWHGWGFHEDGARSGLAAARRLGFDWEPEPTLGLYRTRIRHTRRAPLRHRFSYASHTWVVDVDDLPDYGLRGRFEARDHLGDPHRSIRANLETFCAGRDIDVSGCRILMAANARALGYCFNPISVFWCLDRSGRSIATILEVHNTYGQRHAYLLTPDDRGRAEIDKAMYVSPFHGTDGRYTVRVPVPRGRLDVAVQLTSGDGPDFTAALRGEPVHGRAQRAVVARSAAAAALGSLRIRWQGIGLWRRGLKVRPRPVHARQEGV